MADTDVIQNSGFRQRVRNFIVRHRVSIRDLGLISLIMLVVTFYAYEIDIFKNEGQVSLVEHTIETDEALMLGGILMAAMLIFSIRRFVEQKRETRRRIMAEQTARRLAYQDPLTGLPNRRQLEEAVTVAVGSPPRAGSAHALFMLDLNGFKRINDIYGHGIGDETLIIVAQRLLRAVRDDDLVARLGGDEFCVLARHLSGVDGASSLALRMIERMSEDIVIEGIKHSVGAGIGIAFIPDDADTVTEVFRKADVALYRAKAERRSSLRFFEPEMDKTAREKEKIERRLRTALDHGEIEAMFRPNMDMRSGRVTGFQIQPRIGLSDDGEFAQNRIMAVAEETGLAHHIAHRTLQLACQAARLWPDDIALSFDLFAGQIKDDGLAAGILDLARSTGISPDRLEIGVGESIIVQDLEAVRRAIDPLQQAGAKIALVNFGTGYSNLYHMQAIKLDKVKIDGRFTDEPDDTGAMKIVRALAGLGHGLGMTVVAEGKSLPAHSSGLHGSGVEEYQWAGLSVSSDEALRLVHSGLGEEYSSTEGATKTYRRRPPAS